jgi:uncharacterized NAD(P)/FAD-binding protein YdhS
LSEQRRAIAVIGGGFAGSMLALQLARRAGAGSGRGGEILLFDRGGSFGRGVAYATTNPRHLLNVPAGRMSALADDPDDFLCWLRQTGHAVETGDFIGRGLYGDYLQARLDGTEGIVRVPSEVRRIAPQDDGFVLHLPGGGRRKVDKAVLCTGNFLPASPVERRLARAARPRYIANPWDWSAFEAIGPDERVVLVGSNLTMVDVALELRERGHRGELIALSRHGLLPHAHGPTPAPQQPVDWDTVPHEASALLRALRDAVEREAATGGDWRGVVDSMRPHTQMLWRAAPVEERRRFLRHIKPYWEVHRHRLAPAVARELAALRAEGRLSVLAGHVREVAASDTGIVVTVRERGRELRTKRRIEAGWIVNCSGPAVDYTRTADPLMRGLLDGGQARPGPATLGLDVDADYRLIDAAGHAQPHLSAIGPPIRGALWETTAVPEIRGQCAAVAERLAGEVASSVARPERAQ